MLLKELKEHWFCDKLLETNTHAKENNATNMGQLYCGKMKKIITIYNMEIVNLCVQSSKHM
jgi:hypothetical protein